MWAVCDSPNPPVWLLNAAVIKNKTTNKPWVLFFENGSAENFLILLSLFFKSLTLYSIFAWLLAGDECVSYLLLLPLISWTEQSYSLQHTLLECSETIIDICSLYTVGTISFLDSSLEYFSNYFYIYIHKARTLWVLMQCINYVVLSCEMDFWILWSVKRLICMKMINLLFAKDRETGNNNQQYWEVGSSLTFSKSDPRTVEWIVLNVGVFMIQFKGCLFFSFHIFACLYSFSLDIFSLPPLPDFDCLKFV